MASELTRQVLRRSGQRLWYGLSAVFLAMGLLSGVLGVVAEWRGAEVTCTRGMTAIGLGFGEGYYTFFSWRSSDPQVIARVAPPGLRIAAGGPLTPRAFSLPSSRRRTYASSGGIVIARDELPGGNSIIYMQVPCWMLAIPMLCIAPWWIRWFWRRLRFAREGVCAKCGYDLRATPQRCPECGTPADRSAGSS